MSPRAYRWTVFLLGVALLGQCAGPQLLTDPSTPATSAQPIAAVTPTPTPGCLNLAVTVAPSAVLTAFALLALALLVAAWKLRRVWHARVYGHHASPRRAGYGPRLMP